MLHGGEDGRWAEDWSEDVERTYDAPPPLDLTEFDLALYRRLKRHDSRAGSIRSQKLLAAELGVSVPTIKRSIRRLRYAGWLEISRRPQRNARRGGQLRGGNRYHPKQSLNDLDEEVFPQVATRGHGISAGRNEGSRSKAAKPQVATRDHDSPRSLVGVEERQHPPRSQRGITGSESPASTPTVSESKPVEERVSPQAEAELPRHHAGPSFRTMAEEKAWVAAQRRDGHGACPPPPSARSSKQQELDAEMRVVARNAQRLAALRGDVVAVLWAGDVGYALEPEEGVLALQLRDEGLLEGATLVTGDLRPPAPAPGPVRYGRLRLDAGPRDFHRAVDRLGWDTCVDGSSCGRGQPCPRHQRRRREAS